MTGTLLVSTGHSDYFRYQDKTLNDLQRRPSLRKTEKPAKGSSSNGSSIGIEIEGPDR